MVKLWSQDRDAPPNKWVKVGAGSSSGFGESTLLLVDSPECTLRLTFSHDSGVQGSLLD
jgi:hypothetical protein